MFTARERTLLTSPYFRLIRQTDDFFEIQSRCTKHCWIVQKLSYDRYPVRIYHKHTKGTAYYHKHGHANTVSSAVRQIKSHDVWQLNGRRATAEDAFLRLGVLLPVLRRLPRQAVPPAEAAHRVPGHARQPCRLRISHACPPQRPTTIGTAMPTRYPPPSGRSRATMCGS